jgi:hypothetical protein
MRKIGKSTMTRPLVMLLVWLSLPILSCGQATPRNNAQGEAVESREHKSEKIPLEAFLRELGEKNNCYFTLEEAWREHRGEDLLGGTWVAREEKNGSVTDILAGLQKKNSNLHFEPDSKNPQIIHIIDSRLKRINDYSLDQTLMTFTFTGTTSQLISYLAQQGVGVREAVQPVGPILIVDSTTVSIKTEHAKVRDILSEYLPLDSYNHLLWKAVTRFRADNITDITFYGPQIRKP